MRWRNCAELLLVLPASVLFLFLAGEQATASSKKAGKKTESRRWIITGGLIFDILETAKQQRNAHYYGILSFV